MPCFNGQFVCVNLKELLKKFKKKKDSKETLKRYSFRNIRRQANPSEQVGPISISDYEEDCQKDNLQQ